MAEFTVGDGLDLQYPDPPAWSADGTYLAVPIHGADYPFLRVVPVDESADVWAVGVGDRGLRRSIFRSERCWD